MGFYNLKLESIVVEIKDDIAIEIKSYFSKHGKSSGHGYYLFDAAEAYSKSGGTKLSELEMIQFTDDLWYVWRQEKEFYLERTSANTVTGKCEFLEYIIGNHSKLSTFAFEQSLSGDHKRYS